MGRRIGTDSIQKKGGRTVNKGTERFMRKIFTVVLGAVVVMSAGLFIQPAPASGVEKPVVVPALVTVYDQINRGGKCQNYVSYGTYKASNKTLGLANNSISSIEVRQPVAVTLYENDGTSGKKITFPKGFYNLTDYGFNNMTSSLVIGSGSSFNYGGIVFYIDINENNWGVVSKTKTFADLTVSPLSDIRIMGPQYNDAISCIYVPYGRTVTIYQHINYGGKSLKLTTGVHNLKNYKMSGNTTWDNQLSSYKIQ